MANGKSLYLANATINYQYGNVSYTPPATVYVALFTVAPTPAAGSGTEVTGNNYSRKAVTNNTTNFPSVSNGIKTNGVAITFDQCTPSSWGTVVAWATFDNSSGGNMLHFGDLTPTKTVAASDVMNFPAGTLTIIEG